MSRRHSRAKLRAHDRGIDRHNKGVAHESKAARVAREHQQAVELGNRRRNRREDTR